MENTLFDSLFLIINPYVSKCIDYIKFLWTNHVEKILINKLKCK